jgi:hypothetical protein
MAAPKSNTYRGWYNDAENSTLDVYIGYGGASDPASAATFTSSAATVAGSLTAGTGLVATTGGVHVSAGTISDTRTVVDDDSQDMTLAAADILAGINMHTSVSGGGTVTCDTAANIIAGVPLSYDGQCVTSYYINDGNQTATFAVASGTTIANVANTVLTNSSATLIWQRTASDAVKLYIIN